jgi:hypothetical protein
VTPVLIYETPPSAKAPVRVSVGAGAADKSGEQFQRINLRHPMNVKVVGLWYVLQQGFGTLPMHRKNRNKDSMPFGPMPRRHKRRWRFKRPFVQVSNFGRLVDHDDCGYQDYWSKVRSGCVVILLERCS